MIEMLGVLAIIAVLSVGGIAGYSKAMQKYKLNKVIEQVTTIVSNIQILFANERILPDLDYQYDEKALTFVRDFIFPKDTDVGNLDSNGEIIFTHALGGRIDYFDTSHNKDFVIDIDSLSKESCIALATYDWGGASSGFVGIEIGKRDSFHGSILDCNSRDVESLSFAENIVACRPLNNIPLPLAPDLAAKGCNCTDKSCRIELLFED